MSADAYPADPRIANCLAAAEESRGHTRELAAALAWCFARDAGDTEAMRRAVELGAARYRREPPTYARTEERASESRRVGQLALFDLEVV